MNIKWERENVINTVVDHYSEVNNNGIVIDGSKRFVYRNGEKITIPAYIKGYNITNYNGKIYVDGYELKNNNEWKRTLKALWYKWF